MKLPVSSRCRSDGFTLLEMLVALAITGLLVAILTGALYYVLQAREKLSTELEQGSGTYAVQSWFRLLVGGVVPVLGGKEGAFTGKLREMGMLTTGSLVPGAASTPQWVMLSLERNTEGTLYLYYTENERRFTLGTWEDAEGEFEYFDEGGKGGFEWKVPPQATTNLVPSMVKLDIKAAGQQSLFVSAVSSSGWHELQEQLLFDIGPRTAP